MNKGPGPTDAEKSKAYTAAQRRLREAHQEEFYDFLEAEYKEINYEWQRPKSEEQKAKETIEALLEKHPGLAGQILPANMAGVAAAFGDPVDAAVNAEASANQEAQIPDDPTDPANDFSDPEIPPDANPWGD